MISQDTEQPAPRTGIEPVGPRWAGALAGIIAGGAALAAGEVAGAIAAPRPGPVIAVSNRVIDEAPPWFVDFGKTVFGLADKPALIAGTILISIVFAAVLGMLSLRHRLVGVGGIVGFGLVGLVAMGVDAQGGWGYALFVSTIAVSAGIGTLLLMLARVPAERPQADTGARPANVAHQPAVARRSFLTWVGAAAATIGGLALGARQLRGRAAVEEARQAVELVPLDGASEIDAAVQAAEIDRGRHDARHLRVDHPQ